MLSHVWNLNVAQQVSDFHLNYKFVTGCHLSLYCSLLLPSRVAHANVINYSNLPSANLNFIVSKYIGHLLTDMPLVNKQTALTVMCSETRHSLEYDNPGNGIRAKQIKTQMQQTLNVVPSFRLWADSIRIVQFRCSFSIFFLSLPPRVFTYILGSACHSLQRI